MKKEAKIAFIAILVFTFLFTIFLSISVYAVSSKNETMVVEANILTPLPPEEYIAFEVPDYIFLGNITIGDETNKTKIYVNNTGTVNIVVTPQLKNSSEEIFSYLYFQRRVADPWQRIGLFDMNLNASKTDYFYMKLDLKEFNNLENNLIKHQAEVIFIGMPQ